MVRILITNATIITMSYKHDLIISKGYVFLRNGVVEGIGEGDPPDEFQYPELLINGEGRIVAPGLVSGMTTVTLYPLRYLVNDVCWDKFSDFISLLSRSDVYYLAALTFMELMKRGVTAALVTDIFLENVARAANDLGIYVTLAVPFGCGIKDFDPEHELKLLMSKWEGKFSNIKVAALYCGDPPKEWIDLVNNVGVRAYVLNASRRVKGLSKVVYINPKFEVQEGVDNVIRYGSDLRLWRPNEGLGIGVNPSYSMSSIMRSVTLLTGKSEVDVLASATVINSKLIGHESLGNLESGATANIVMYDTSEPPGWPVITDLRSLTKALVLGDLIVETVIVGDDILVDNKETLTIGYDLVKKAVHRLRPILKRYVSIT